MKIIDIKDYRKYYKSIRPVADELDEDFVGNYYVDKNGSKKYGWFTMYYGDRDGFSTPREGVENFLKSFLEMARDTQAVYEFLQNAVDAGSSHFTMVWEKDEVDGNYYLLVANNGSMFSVENVRSILNVGSSTKSSDNDTIGQFGIGFKLAHRLVGKDNGLEELIDEQSGPVLFSWKNYEIQNIIDNQKLETVEVFKDYYNLENINLEINNPWLFKILVACFPCAPQNADPGELPRSVQGELGNESPFSEEEFSTFSRWLKKHQNILSEKQYKEGSIFFIKLGKGKHTHLGQDNLREGIKFSLAVLKETENDEEKKRKKILNTVQINNEEEITFPELEYINLVVSKEIDQDEFSYAKFGFNKYSDLTKEQQNKFNENADIEILFGFRPFNSIGDYFKGAPNFYLYFPLSEEVHNFNFILHCNAFYQGASRTFLHEGNINEGGINERLFEVIIKKVDKTLHRLSESKNPADRQKFLHFYSALLTSGRSLTNTRRWIDKPFVDKLDRLLLKYIPVKKNNQEEDFIVIDRPNDIFIKKTNLDVDFNNIDGDKYWFYWDNENYEYICIKASQKLALKDFTIYNLLTISKVEYQRINSWLDTNYEKTKTLLKELALLSDDEIKSDLLRSNLFNIDLLHFSDRSFMSLNEFENRESEGYFLIYKTLSEIRHILERSNLKISIDNIDDFRFERFFTYKQKKDSQLRGHTDLTRFFSKHIDEKFLIALNEEEKFQIFTAFRKFHDENITNRIKELRLLSDNSGKPKKFKNLLASTAYQWLEPYLVKKDKYFDEYRQFLITSKEDIYQYIVFTYWKEIFNVLASKNMLTDAISKDIADLYSASKWEEKEQSSLVEVKCIKYKNEIIEAEPVLYNSAFLKFAAEKYTEYQDILLKYFDTYLPDIENLKFVTAGSFNLEDQEIPTRLNKENLSEGEIKILLAFFKILELSFFDFNTISKERDSFTISSRNSLHQFFVSQPLILEAVNKSNLKNSFVLLPPEFVDFSNDVAYNEQKIAGHIISNFTDSALRRNDLFSVLKFASQSSKKTFLESIPHIIIHIDGTESDLMNDYVAVLGDLFSGNYSDEDLDKITAKIKLKHANEEISLKNVDSVTSTVIIKDLNNNDIALSKSSILGIDSDIWFQRISDFHRKAVTEGIISAKSSEKLFKMTSESKNEMLKEVFCKGLPSYRIENSHQLAFLLFSKVFTTKEIKQFYIFTANNEWQKLSGQYYFHGDQNIKFIEPQFILHEKYCEVVELLNLKTSTIVNYGQEKEDIISTIFLLTNGADPNVLKKDLVRTHTLGDHIIEREIERIDYLYKGWRETPINTRKKFNKLEDFSNWRDFLGNASPMFFSISHIGNFSYLFPAIYSKWFQDDDDKFKLLQAIDVIEEDSYVGQLLQLLYNKEVHEFSIESLHKIHPDLLFKIVATLMLEDNSDTHVSYSLVNDAFQIEILVEILQILHAKQFSYIPSLVFLDSKSVRLISAVVVVYALDINPADFTQLQITERPSIFRDYFILHPTVNHLTYQRMTKLSVTENIADNVIATEDDTILREKWKPKEPIEVKYCDKVIINYKIFLRETWYNFAIKEVKDYFIQFDWDLHEDYEVYTIFVNNNYTLDYVIDKFKELNIYANLLPDLEELSKIKKDFITNIVHSLSQINLNNLEDDNIVQLKKFIEQQGVKEERQQLIASLNNNEEGLVRYSYKWFYTYLKLLGTFNEKSSNRPLRKISFNAIETTGKDNFYLLSGNSSYLSDSIDDVVKPSFKMVFKDGTKEILNLISISKQHQNLIIQTSEKLSEEKFRNVFQLEIEYAPITDLLEKLTTAFEKLKHWEDIKEVLPPLEYVYGPPGTGKTHNICQRVISENKESASATFFIMTPTNKAADVIGERLLKNGFTSFLRLSGQTSLKLPEEYYTNKLFEDDLYDNKVLISTIHRLPYYDLFDGESNERLHNFKNHWDYIVVDEASMVNLPYLVFALLKLSESNSQAKILVAGDPMQIPPVPEVNDSILDELDIVEENIYKMMGLKSFDKNKQNEEVRQIDKVTYLDIQYRSIPEIGNLFNHYSYGGNIDNARLTDNQKKIPEQWKKILRDTFNLVNIPVNQSSDLYKVNRLIYSSYHLYSCILTCEILKFLDDHREDDKVWTIGIITPYKAQAVLINRLKENFNLSKNLKITADTVHGFQGDQCEIVFVVVNPNNYYYTGHEKSLLTKQYIYNVAISRAEDYLVMIAPFEDITQNTHLNNLMQIHKNNNLKEAICITCDTVEKLLFKNVNFIEENSYVTTHDDINVFNNTTWKYYIKKASTAIDFQLNF